MGQLGSVSELLLGIVIGCVGSLVFYGIVLPRIRARRQVRNGQRPQRQRITLRSHVTPFPHLGRGVKHLFSSLELVIGLLIVLALALVAIAAPVLAPPEDVEDPYVMPLETRECQYQPPPQLD